MNERLKCYKQRLRAGQHKSLRQARRTDDSLADECERQNLSWIQRSARLTRRQCESERVVIRPDERIVFTRTLLDVPPIYSKADWEKLTAGHTLHELGPISNICADWGMVLAQGLDGRRQAALAACNQRGQEDPAALEFLDCAIETMDAVQGLADRYAEAARLLGRQEIAGILEQVPAKQPRTFHEALQSLRLLQAAVWLSGHYHVGLGRFDQYMWSYLQQDLESGRLDLAGAEELLAEFFISLNKDSDLYPGVQQGDNGQTITLGGVRRDGSSAVNELTRMALRVSCELEMIDPKINLRISADTEVELLCLATELTRKGLGFPQYSNDEVVIPALAAHGYDLEDARDYVVAACWEFIIPGQGMDVVNIGAVSLPAAVDQGIRAGLTAGDDFAGILRRVQADVHQQVQQVAGRYESLLLPPAPYYSVLMDNCLEMGRDLSRGNKYNNFGIHGAGAANAADALAAVQKFIFQERSLRSAELISALDANFADCEELRRKLFDDAPKVGNNDEQVDVLLSGLFETLADACEAYGQNSRGGIVRPGTGSAMYYIWLAQGHEGMREPLVGATAEGRPMGQPLGANLAPTQGARIRGPFSALQSFAKIDYKRVCNGGPITLELSDTVFRNPEAIRQVALLVRAFAQLGCQQLQLNALSLDTLLDARTHPDLHKNLIVRVWGWSGYFCELGPEYQEQIIARHMFSLT
ncbi:MAG: pyruvate formate lyase family protein [Anaerolineaceae bacterium]|nr:pyruvate formate lyase family protein [Anaerolineaceae bacterium]